MRVAQVRVSAFWLEMIFHGHEYSRLETDFPRDAQIVSAVWEAEKQTILLHVMSDEFDDVQPGFVVPEWMPTITKHMDETAQLLDIVHRGMNEEATST